VLHFGQAISVLPLNKSAPELLWVCKLLGAAKDDESGIASKALHEGHLHFFPALLAATRRVFEHWLHSNSMLMNIDRGKGGTSSGGSGFWEWAGGPF
jgi:hypothetical protein